MDKKFKCPECGKDLDHVFVVSECCQKARLDKAGHIVEYEAPEVGHTIATKCPHCDTDVTCFEENAE